MSSRFLALSLASLAVTACVADPEEEIGTDEAEIAIPPDTYFKPVRPAVRGGAINGYALIGRYSAALLDQVAQVDGHTRMFPVVNRALCDVSLWEMSYKTTAPEGNRLADATGALMMPSGNNPACSGGPVLTVGQGSQLDTNARAADPAAFVTRELAVFYASQGYNVLIPDYLGNGSAANFPGTTKFPYHPYLHAQTEGSTLLDAIRASRGWLGARRVMFLGGSQGAHAVAAAYLLATQYPGEFDVRAAAFNGAPFDVPAEVAYAASQPALLPLYNKAMTAWATLYNGGWALSSAQRVAIARANDIAGIPSLTPSPSVQLCGTPYDTTVPFSYTTTMQTRLGGYAVPLLQVGASDLGTGTAAYPGLGGNAHAIAGTICIGRELAYFNARR